VSGGGEVRVRPDFGLDAPPIVYGYAVLGMASGAIFRGLG